jgi:hypothetical protein
MGLDNFKCNKFPFWPNFQIPLLNYNFQEQTQFETYLNFKRVRTFWKKSHKFTKILTSDDLHKYEFRLTHLYSNIRSSFTSGK